MQITTTTGHLTATNKRHIKAIFEAGLREARANRIDYSIKPLSQPGHYQVRIAKADNSIVIGEKVERSKATFKIH